MAGLEPNMPFGARRLFVVVAAFACGACGGGNEEVGEPSGGGSGNRGGQSSSTGGQGGASGEAGASGEPMCQSAGTVMEMVEVSAGEFLMGCNEEVDTECEDDEKPSRMIVLDAFEIDQTEVTQDQYAACIEAGACTSPSCDWDCERADYPATCIDRSQASAYCESVGKHLPTEAQWEKAARGTQGFKYPWGNEEPTCELANTAGCEGDATPAGSLPAGASPYGALDMAGNMVEILADWYDPAYYGQMPDTNPPGPAQGNQYVGRGGGFKSESFWNRASVRDWYDLEDAGASLGFRCAR